MTPKERAVVASNTVCPHYGHGNGTACECLTCLASVIHAAEIAALEFACKLICRGCSGGVELHHEPLGMFKWRHGPDTTKYGCEAWSVNEEITRRNREAQV